MAAFYYISSSPVKVKGIYNLCIGYLVPPLAVCATLPTCGKAYGFCVFARLLHITGYLEVVHSCGSLLCSVKVGCALFAYDRETRGVVGFVGYLFACAETVGGGVEFECCLRHLLQSHILGESVLALVEQPCNVAVLQWHIKANLAQHFAYCVGYLLPNGAVLFCYALFGKVRHILVGGCQLCLFAAE